MTTALNKMVAAKHAAIESAAGWRGGQCGRAAGLILLTVVVTGCEAMTAWDRGIQRVHAGWREQNADFLAETGSRQVRADPEVSLVATQAALTRIGLTVDDVNRQAGVVKASRLLNEDVDIGPEVRAAELDYVRRIMKEEAGERGTIAELSIGQQSRLGATATVAASGNGSQVSVRMCNLTRVREGVYLEGDCLIPTSRLKAGVSEFWAAFDSELGARLPAEASPTPAPRVAQASGTRRPAVAAVPPARRVESSSVEPAGPIVEPSGWVLPD